MRPKHTAAVSLIIILSAAAAFASSNAQYPLITSLDPSDILFRQLTSDVDRFYINRENGSKLPPLLVFRYVVKKDDSVFSVAARLNISIEAIVTLNSMENPEALSEGETIFLPNLPGIFVNKKPETDLEYLISSWRKEPEDAAEITIYRPEKTTFFFLPGEVFHSVERSFFFGIMFRFPLPKGKITSRFGYRMQPFTGKPEFHRGIDIGAPEGTSVLAARGGTVKETGEDSICGNYIVLTHETGFETKYCHLKKIFVSLHQQVRSGMIIGEVGMTGMATGPHLHFEIRERGRRKDPLKMMQGK